VRCPLIAKAAAKLIEVVVFPTPPFWLATVGNPNQIWDLLKCQVVVSKLRASRSFDQKTARFWVSRETGEGLPNSDFFSVKMFHTDAGNVSVWPDYSRAAL